MRAHPREVLVFVFFLSMVAILTVTSLAFSSASDTEVSGTRGSGDYQGAIMCQNLPGCHSDEYSTWATSPHASAWDTLNSSSEKQDWCEVCHTTGAEDTAHNGFDPATDQPDYLKNVQCESCHGPDPMSLTDPSTAVDFSSEVCGACHTSAEFNNQSKTYHPYYDEWLNSRHAQSLTAAGGSVATDPDCQGCHVAQVAIAESIEGGIVERPITNPQPITCAVCHDPHGTSNPSQLRLDPADLCATCHNPGVAKPGEEIRHPQSSMRKGESAIDTSLVPKKTYMTDILCSDCHLYSTGPPLNATGHSFAFKPEACSDCHTGNPNTFPLTVDQAMTSVSAYQSATLDLMHRVLANLVVAQSAIQDAPEYGFSISTIEVAQGYADEANYSYNFVVSDKSLGAHNPQYALSLLEFALNRTETVIDLLMPGEVTGRILSSDGSPISGVVLRRSGMDLATTGSDGKFSFGYASGTYTFELVRDGNHLGTISGVMIKGGETTDVGDVKASYERPFDWTLVLGGIIIVLAIIVIFLLWRSTKKSKPAEKSPDGKVGEGDEDKG